MSVINASPFNGSGAVINKKDYIIKPDGNSKGRTNESFFENYKAQCWWHIREMFKETHEAVTLGRTFTTDNIISISSKCSNINRLAAELSQPTYKKTNKGKLLINKTPDGAKSPNDADSVMMVFAPKEGNYNLSAWG